MPCSDVTEMVLLELDAGDRLTSYSLYKGTCSGNVGDNALLIDRLKGRTVEEILAADDVEILDGAQFKRTVDEFLHYKHLVAIRSALAAMIGEASPYQNRACELDEISYGPEGTSLAGRIKVDILTDEIRACGRCAGCK